MKKPMFENYAKTNESMCNGCLCRCACTDRIRKRNRQLVCCACKVQKLMREWIDRVNELEPKDIVNLPQLAMCHFGDVYDSVLDTILADDKNFIGNNTQAFRRLLLCELNTLENMLLQFARQQPSEN